MRARLDAHAFRRAWDAAVVLAYEGLRELALDRARNGLEQRTYDPEGNLIARKIVHNDRLLMFLIDHHKPHAGSVDDAAFATAILALDTAPAGPEFCRLSSGAASTSI